MDQHLLQTFLRTSQNYTLTAQLQEHTYLYINSLHGQNPHAAFGMVLAFIAAGWQHAEAASSPYFAFCWLLIQNKGLDAEQSLQNSYCILACGYCAFDTMLGLIMVLTTWRDLLWSYLKLIRAFLDFDIRGLLGFAGLFHDVFWGQASYSSTGLHFHWSVALVQGALVLVALDWAGPCHHDTRIALIYHSLSWRTSVHHKNWIKLTLKLEHCAIMNISEKIF